ncbi:MAG TPA: hypothetical protein VMR18_02140 [Candidatus Saccharimonadales bacterium]|nr:hypothetical protein [Candidatus Saccharimonadales bacterium]
MHNELEHLAEFDSALADYHLSEDGKKILERTKLVLLTAPTSVGRNTMILEALKSGRFDFMVSDTTRLPRINNGALEQNGREYWFRSEQEMLDDIRSGAFLEAAVIHDQQVSGTSLRELKKAADNHKIAIADVEVTGAENIYRLKPDTLFCFVLPPSFEEWLKRLHKRGRLPDDEVKRRLTSAVKEFQTALNRPYYKFIINDDLERAVKQIEKFANTGIIDSASQQSAKDLAHRLLIGLKHYLKAQKS